MVAELINDESNTRPTTAGIRQEVIGLVAVQDIEQIAKYHRKDKPHNDRPSKDIRVVSAIAASHTRQQIKTMRIFMLPQSKHRMGLL
jgi:hypothetical protein